MTDETRHPLQQLLQRHSRGQSAILLAVSFVAFMAFVGFAIDAGLLYLRLTQLRRAVDAAALAGAVEAREAPTTQAIADAATQFVQLHGFPGANVNVDLCGADYDPTMGAPYYDTSDPGYDSDLCIAPPRKLIRVDAATDVNFAFIPIIPGFPHTTTIVADAVAEAASLEIVLVLDTSMSMTYEASASDGDDDDGDTVPDDADDDRYRADGTDCDPFTQPWVCEVLCNENTPTDEPQMVTEGIIPAAAQQVCMPFEAVRAAARAFVNQVVLEDFDRVSIVEFAGEVEKNYPEQYVGQTTTRVYQQLIDPDATSVTATLSALNGLVVTPNYGVHPLTGEENAQGCLVGIPGEFADISTAGPWYNSNPGPCQATNIGGGLRAALEELENARQGALRFIILLSDGETNTTDVVDPSASVPTAFCSNSVNSSANNYDYWFKFRSCTDGDARVRHGIDTDRFEPPTTYTNQAQSNPSDPISTNNDAIFDHYDAEDYARYWADQIRAEGNVVMFSIGLGPAVTENSPNADSAARAVGSGWTEHAAGYCDTRNGDNEPVNAVDYSDTDYEGDFSDMTKTKNANHGNPDCMPNGEQLLRYVADQGDGTDTGVCGLRTTEDGDDLYEGLYLFSVGTSCGNYFFAPDSGELGNVFDAIAERIFTRLTQ